MVVAAGLAGLVGLVTEVLGLLAAGLSVFLSDDGRTVTRASVFVLELLTADEFNLVGFDDFVDIVDLVVVDFDDEDLVVDDLLTVDLEVLDVDLEVLDVDLEVLEPVLLPLACAKASD